MKSFIAKSVAVLLLSALMLTSCASGGGDSKETDGNNNPSDTSVTSADVTTADPYADELDEYDFDGSEFHMFNRTNENCHYSIEMTEETGDVLDDAIYLRNRNLEERFNFKFAQTSENPADKARSAVLAGDDTYDIIHTRCVFSFDYAVEGLLIPLYDIPVIDLDKPYWDKDSTEAISFLGNTYFAIGNYNLTTYDFIHIMLFNKQLAENNGIDDIYGLVSDGKWTYDKFEEYGKLTVLDVNGDGAMGVDDSYGYQSGSKQVLPNFWISAGQLSMHKNENDVPEMTIGNDEMFFTVIEKIFNICYDSGVWMRENTSGNLPEACINSFIGGRSLFMDCTFFYVNKLRAMDSDFGIIPYPKWNEEQEEYCARTEHGEFPCIPVTNKDLEMTGVILEALSSESAKTVIPAYYDISLQGKITRDEESVEMIDLIFDNRVFDWGDTIYCDQIRDGVIHNMMQNNDRDLASKVATMQKVVDSRTTKALEALQ